MLLSYEGHGVEEIAAQLGLDAASVERLIQEAETDLQTIGPPLRIRHEEQADWVPNHFTTHDGIVVPLLGVPAEDAVNTWRDLWAKADEVGLWPALLPDRGGLPGHDPLLRVIEEAARTTASPAEWILEQANELDPKAVLYEGWERGYPSDEDDEEIIEAFSEEIPDGPVQPIETELVPSTGTATIALVPCGGSSEIPSVFGFGGWNACPPPEEHVAILRYWEERNDARLQAIALDTLEMEVARPPMTYPEALALAKEHYAYTSDILFQGSHPAIGALAVALLGSDRWHFWWD
jgi:hypothetical protein